MTIDLSNANERSRACYEIINYISNITEGFLTGQEATLGTNILLGNAFNLSELLEEAIITIGTSAFSGNGWVGLMLNNPSFAATHGLGLKHLDGFSADQHYRFGFAGDAMLLSELQTLTTADEWRPQASNFPSQGQHWFSPDWVSSLLSGTLYLHWENCTSTDVTVNHIELHLK